MSFSHDGRQGTTNPGIPQIMTIISSDALRTTAWVESPLWRICECRVLVKISLKHFRGLFPLRKLTFPVIQRSTLAPFLSNMFYFPNLHRKSILNPQSWLLHLYPRIKKHTVGCRRCWRLCTSRGTMMLTSEVMQPVIVFSRRGSI